jgi:hypothetical protein
MRPGLELMSTLLNEKNPKQVIDTRHRFVRRRYGHEFGWEAGRKKGLRKDVDKKGTLLRNAK